MGNGHVKFTPVPRRRGEVTGAEPGPPDQSTHQCGMRTCGAGDQAGSAEDGACCGCLRGPMVAGGARASCWRGGALHLRRAYLSSNA